MQVQHYPALLYSQISHAKNVQIADLTLHDLLRLAGNHCCTHTLHPLKYVVSTNGILVTVAVLRLPRTSTLNSVPVLVYFRGT